MDFRIQRVNETNNQAIIPVALYLRSASLFFIYRLACVFMFTQGGIVN